MYMEKYTAVLSQDNHNILICRSSWVGGPRLGAGGQAFGRGFWYFSTDNGITWKISHLASKMALETKIKQMPLSELAKINEL